jgi:hypothetical protein
MHRVLIDPNISESSITWRPKFQYEDEDRGNTKIFHGIDDGMAYSTASPLPVSLQATASHKDF